MRCSTTSCTRRTFKVAAFPYIPVDQWKIYPTEITPWTVIKQWFDSGRFVPYSDEVLMEVLLKAKRQVADVLMLGSSLDPAQPCCAGHTLPVHPWRH